MAKLTQAERTPLLTGVHLTKEYLREGGGTNMMTAVRDVTVSLYRGEVTLLSGRSGSGKTTLLCMLSGLLRPSGGEVCFLGESLYEKEEEALSLFRNTHFGSVPQGQSGIGSLTVLENVLLPLSLYGREAGHEEEAKGLLCKLGIESLTHELPARLSGGELRRMAIARALITHPDVLFLDEPTGDLDDENTALVLRLFSETAKAGAAVLLVSHEATAEDYADTVLRMDGGTL